MERGKQMSVLADFEELGRATVDLPADQVE